MRFVLKVIYESIVQALQQLTGNKLRSFLSLLGVTIGIFCIIGVRSAVDSLEFNIKQSFEKLGNNVVYVSKMPWKQFSEDDFFRYLKRPSPSFYDYRNIKERSKLAEACSFSLGLGAFQPTFRNNSIDNVFVVSVTHDYDAIFKLDIVNGRYFSGIESNTGASKCILGDKVAAELFGSTDPIGQEIESMGRKFQVIGVLNKKGQDFLSIMNFDMAMIIPFEFGRKMVNIKSPSQRGGNIAIKAQEGVSIEDLKDELTGIIRSHRRLKPMETENFALNESSLLTSLIEQFFKVLNTAGFVIGIFALIVGAFSVANIMFVSVKERTGIIGIKKALGARRWVILLEFLIESIMLCIIGGIFGLFFVYGILTLVSLALDFDIFLSFRNIIIGIIGSVIVGVVSGIIPAINASGLDPVEAMRK